MVAEVTSPNTGKWSNNMLNALTLINENQQNHENNTETSNAEDKTKNQSYHAKACIAANSDNKDLRWLIDSGASHHMTYSEAWFKNLLDKSEKITVRIADEWILKSQECGDIELPVLVSEKKEIVTISNVYFISELKSNLLLFETLEKKI